MKLYLLRPKCGEGKRDQPEDSRWEPWFDKAFGFVVRAEDEKMARELATQESGDECGYSYTLYKRTGDAWTNPKHSTCIELMIDGEPGVIIRDFASA